MSPGPPPFSALPRPARNLVWSVAALAVAAVAVAQVAVAGPLDLAPFLICLAVCTLGSFFEVRAPGGYYLQPHLPAFVAAAVLLPPWAVAAVAVAVFVPGAVTRRERWYRPTFNATTFALAGALAGVVNHALAVDEVSALLAASVALVVVNHVLVSAVAGLARGDEPGRALADAVQLRTTLGAGLFFDLALALTGAALAALWLSYPAALPLVAGPAALVCA